MDARKSVLITGCASGFGLETALYLAERGFRVFASVPYEADEPGVTAAAAERGVALDVPRLDVTDRASIEEAIAGTVDASGPLFGLVNNAGLGLRGCFEDVSDAEMRSIFDVNVLGAMAVTQAALPELRAAGEGRIVTISSVGGRIASFGLSGYCATKFALEGFGEALALEAAPFGLYSVLIEPGVINTPHWTTNRGTAQRALDPTSPYAAMFRRHEALADKRRAATKTQPIDVARVVHRALTARRPRLRYVVGQPAGFVVAMRRYLPDRVFERLYFGLLVRQLTREEPLHPDSNQAAGVD